MSEVDARQAVRDALIGQPAWIAAMWLTKRANGASYKSIAKEMGL